MCLPDTAEYWWDVKASRPFKKVFTHIKGKECGHFHVYESDEFDDIDCYACLKLLGGDEDLKARLVANNGKRERRYLAKKKRKKGYKLESKIGFGKFKGVKTIQELINTEKSYWSWLKDKILLHQEVDKYLE